MPTDSGEGSATSIFSGPGPLGPVVKKVAKAREKLCALSLCGPLAACRKRQAGRAEDEGPQNLATPQSQRGTRRICGEPNGVVLFRPSWLQHGKNVAPFSPSKARLQFAESDEPDGPGKSGCSEPSCLVGEGTPYCIAPLLNFRALLWNLWVWAEEGERRKRTSARVLAKGGVPSRLASRRP